MKKFATLALTSLSALTLASCSLLQQVQDRVAPAASTPSSSLASSSAASSSSASSSVAKATVSMDDAKKAAFDLLGITEADVTNLQVKEDTENGKPVYEIDFDHEGMEHSYTVDGMTGEVVERDKEAADATSAAGAAASSATEGSSEATATDAESTDAGSEATDSAAAEETSAAATAAVNLSADDAKAQALADFASVYGTTEADLTNLVVNTDTEDGVTVYDIDFNFNGSEVSYTIDAETGTFLDYSMD